MTITYLLNAPDTGDSDCTPAADHNNKMDEAGQTTETLTASIASLSDEITHAFTTEAGDPSVTDWPAASGGDPYFFNFNVTTAGGDVTYGLLTAGGSNGEFVRVNSACARQEGVVQDEGVFSGTGIQSASNATWNPAAGANTDRFQVRVAAVNTHMHNAQSLAIDTDSNSDAGGPWAAAGIILPIFSEEGIHSVGMGGLIIR